MKRRVSLIGLLVQGIAIQSAYAVNTTDVERERIVIFSRQGEAQLAQGIEQLKELYYKTNNHKVRDDLIALMLRKAQYQEALSICANCQEKDLTESELENLAKAARSVKKLPQSASLYAELSKRFPKNPNGLLGSALVTTELGNYSLAKSYIQRYERQFGQDAGIKDAQRYLADHTDSDMVKLGRWQDELEKEPKNTALAKKLYLLAAKYNIFTLQQKLSTQYPDVFNQKDTLWREQTAAVNIAKGDASKSQIRHSYAQLGEVLTKLDPKHPLYIQTLQDRFVLSTRLENVKEAEANYAQLLLLEQKQPQYVQEAYADLLMMKGSPFAALDVYQQIEQGALQQQKVVTDNLLFKLASASSDAGYFSLAQSYLAQVKDNPYVNDFTRTRRIANPSFDRLYFNKVHLALWRGDSSLAESLLSERLNDKSPGDPWTMLVKSEVSQARARTDDAAYWAERAKDFLGSKDQVYANMRLAEVALDVKDLRKAHDLLYQFSESERDIAKDLIKRDELARSGRVELNAGISHRTYPSDQGNEVTQDYKIHTPKTINGHSAYIHYLESKSPSDNLTLVQRRIGAGALLNFYPVNLQVEAGKGIKLNDKSYLSFNLNYRLNQSWQFELSSNINGSTTPVRAINQGVYTKDIGFATTYTYSDRLRSGFGANFMKFDDGNLRKDAYWWMSAETFRHDRWVLTNTLRFDYEQNKNISSASYYNPRISRSFDVGADLAYIQPMDHNLRLTHHLKVSTGQFKQSDQPNNKKWSISYAHEWRIGKKLGLSYEVGRKKSIYDGNPEYNNFANMNIGFYF